MLLYAFSHQPEYWWILTCVIKGLRLQKFQCCYSRNSSYLFPLLDHIIYQFHGFSTFFSSIRLVFDCRLASWRMQCHKSIQSCRYCSLFKCQFFFLDLWLLRCDCCIIYGPWENVRKIKFTFFVLAILSLAFCGFPISIKSLTFKLERDFLILTDVN